MNPKSLWVATLLAGAVLLGSATPALAHARLESSNPAEGQALDTAPTSVSLTFAEEVTLPADPITIAGPDGTPWTVGTPTVSGATITAPVTPAGPAGAYTLTYTVTSDDGDPVKGTIAFSLTAPADPTTAAAAVPSTSAAAAAPEPAPAAPAAATPQDTGGGTAWVWIVGAIVVIAAIGAVAVARNRRSRTPQR